MIDQKKLNIVITEGLKRATGCEIVKANLAGAPIPPYPYISFNILNSETLKGTYSVSDGVRTMPVKQTWSITTQGGNDNETLHVAMAAKDWFEESGRTILNDSQIVVQDVGAIVNRDTFLTIEYEYRKGFDVILLLLNQIGAESKETIEHINIEGVN